MNTVDYSLDLIRQNTSKLGEYYENKYKSLKNNVWITTTLPITAVSVFNVTYSIGGPYFGTTYYGETANKVATIILFLYTFSQTIGFNFDSKIEKYLTLHNSFKHMSEDVKEKINEEPKYLEKTHCLEKTFEKYKNMIDGNEIIDQFNGMISTTTDSINERKEDVQSFLEDHWNIIFRPSLRRIKSKNEKLIKMFEENGKNIVDEIENQTKKNSFLKSISNPFTTKKEDIENKPKSSEDLEMNNVYTEKETTIPTAPVNNKSPITTRASSPVPTKVISSKLFFQNR